MVSEGGKEGGREGGREKLDHSSDSFPPPLLLFQGLCASFSFLVQGRRFAGVTMEGRWGRERG